MNKILILEDLELPNAELYYIRNFIDNPDDVYKSLLNEIPWKQEQVIVFGKEFDQPRLSCFLGEEGKSYTYSGIKRDPIKMGETMISLSKQIQDVVQKVNKKHPLYSSALANYYCNGNNYIGAHSDDEKSLVADSFIASLSVGAVRFFDIYSKESKKKILRLELENGSLVLMGKNMQKLYKHSVPKQKKIKDGRINITWRVVISEKDQ